MCNWITLLYTWNIVSQLYFNKKEKEKKKKIYSANFCLLITLLSPLIFDVFLMLWLHYFNSFITVFSFSPFFLSSFSCFLSIIWIFILCRRWHCVLLKKILLEHIFHMIFVFLCLTYSTVIVISRSIHVAANGIISFIFVAE